MVNKIDAVVGLRIKNRRTALRISQAKLGQWLGISFQQIQKYEKGTNRIGAGRLYQIAKFLDVSVAELFGEMSPPLPAKMISLEEKSEPPIYRQVQSSYSEETTELLNAFNHITDASVRRQIINLIQTLSQSYKKNDA